MMERIIFCKKGGIENEENIFFKGGIENDGEYFFGKNEV